MSGDHDHTIQAAPGDRLDAVHARLLRGLQRRRLNERLRGRAAQRLRLWTLQLAQSVDGEPLTSAETIEAGMTRRGPARIGRWGAVFVGTVSPAR